MPSYGKYFKQQIEDKREAYLDECWDSEKVSDGSGKVRTVFSTAATADLVILTVSLNPDVCVSMGVCLSFCRDVGNLTQSGYYKIYRDHVLRSFAPLVSIWPSGSGQISGFYSLISNLELLPKACQVFILMKHLTFLWSMFFRSHQIEKHLKNIFFLKNKNIFSYVCSWVFCPVPSASPRKREAQLCGFLE